MVRGASFEKLIEWQNNYYEKKGFGIVQKIATPTFKTKLGDVYRKKSTVDYIGFLSGLGICFDAKECSGDLFQFGNIKDHQIDFLVKAFKGEALSFILLHFKKYHSIYIIPIKKITELKNLGKKSISIKDILSVATLVTCSGFGMIDYLKTIKEI